MCTASAVSSNRGGRSLPARQRGLSLVGLIFMGLLAILLFALGMKVVPAFTEYMAIERAVGRVGNEGTTVRDVRSAFDKYATLDDIKSITSRDLDITKDGDRIVVSFSYTYSVTLLQNVRLAIDFAGSNNAPGNRPARVAGD